MKTITFISLIVLSVSQIVNAQNAAKVSLTHMNDREKMLIFRSWEGHWQGEGTMQQGTNLPSKTTVDERISYKVNNMILCVEGIGKSNINAEEKVVHNAFGVLSYDKATASYHFKTHLADGRSTDSWFTVVEEDEYQWGFDVPSGKVRYNIILDPEKKTWNEVGEFSPDGQKWHKFFEMNLKKVE